MRMMMNYLVLLSVLGVVFSTAGSVFAASTVFNGNIRLRASALSITVALSAAAGFAMLGLSELPDPDAIWPSIAGGFIFLLVPMICTCFYFEKSEKKMPTESIYASASFGLIARFILLVIELPYKEICEQFKLLRSFSELLSDSDYFFDIEFDVQVYAVVSLVLMLICLISFLSRFKKTQEPLRVAKLGKKLYFRLVFFCISAVCACIAYLLPENSVLFNNNETINAAAVTDDAPIDSVLFNNNNNETVKLLLETIFLIMTISALVILIIYALHSYLDAKYSEEHARQELSRQLEHYVELEKKQLELRKIRHDFKGNLSMLARLINTDNIPDALSYIYSLDVRLDDTRMPFITGNSLLDGILSSKKLKFDEKGIALTFKGVFPDKGIDNLDICNIFDNALNNAYEACVKLSTDAFTSISSNIVDNRVWVKIKNPTNHIEKIENGIVRTTKNDNWLHGLGMSSMQKAIAKYDGNIKTSYETEKYKNKRFVILFDLKFKDE
ncbi:MAG: GHKL domain-containing protein [Clostridia bacterium]|nr:GHKL domain-containing protein [Clostridia bacterium]